MRKMLEALVILLVRLICPFLLTNHLQNIFSVNYKDLVQNSITKIFRTQFSCCHGKTKTLLTLYKQSSIKHINFIYYLITSN